MMNSVRFTQNMIDIGHQHALAQGASIGQGLQNMDAANSQNMNIIQNQGTPDIE